MLVFNIITFALVYHPLVTLAQTDMSPKPRIYTNQLFHAHNVELPLDGSCQALDRQYNRNVGSVYIPCEAASGMKNMCTLYSDKICGTAIVAFDRSHASMFEASRSDRGPIAYVGGIVESFKCEVVDVDYSVANTNGHVSTRSQYRCPGDAAHADANESNWPHLGSPVTPASVFWVPLTQVRQKGRRITLRHDFRTYPLNTVNWVVACSQFHNH